MIVVGWVHGFDPLPKLLNSTDIIYCKRKLIPKTQNHLPILHYGFTMVSASRKGN